MARGQWAPALKALIYGEQHGLIPDRETLVGLLDETVSRRSSGPEDEPAKKKVYEKLCALARRR